MEELDESLSNMHDIDRNIMVSTLVKSLLATSAFFFFVREKKETEHHISY